MAEIRLIRADFRLIHGQVITKWINQSGADRIIIIDDVLSQDEFMSSIYTMSAPMGFVVEIYSVEEACSRWKQNRLGDGNLFVLFSNVDQIYKAFQGGFPFRTLQIGGLGSAPGRRIVYGAITMDEHDVRLLKHMQDSGTLITLHQVPDEPKMDFSTMLRKTDFPVD